MKNIALKKAETLLEVLVAVAVIMIILAPTAALYIGSTRDTAMNRNDLAGQALAEEGIELVRNIRDSNLLRFSSKAEHCWDTKPEHTDLADCENNKIADGSYKIAVNLDDFGWVFTAAAVSMSNDLSVSTDEDYRLRLDPNTHIYNYLTDPVTTMTNFYREIRVSKIDFTNVFEGTDEIFIESRVLYRNGRQVRAVTKTVSLIPPQP